MKGSLVLIVEENILGEQKQREVSFPLEYNLEKGLIAEELLTIFYYLLCMRGER